ncbi:hypothetical protein DXA26_22820, partial [Bacteroides fragilis]
NIKKKKEKIFLMQFSSVLLYKKEERKNIFNAIFLCAIVSKIRYDIQKQDKIKNRYNTIIVKKSATTFL